MSWRAGGDHETSTRQLPEQPSVADEIRFVGLLGVIDGADRALAETSGWLRAHAR
jgi:hypothetical protein